MDADRARRPEDVATAVRPPTGAVLTDLLEPVAVPDRGPCPLRGPEGPIAGPGPEWLPADPTGPPGRGFPDQPVPGRTGRWRLVLAYGLILVVLAVALGIATALVIPARFGSALRAIAASLRSALPSSQAEAGRSEGGAPPGQPHPRKWVVTSASGAERSKKSPYIRLMLSSGRGEPVRTARSALAKPGRMVSRRDSAA